MCRKYDADSEQGYFDKAGIEMPWENVLHCDGKGIAKPDLSLYRDMLDNQFAGQEVWFGASHAWDCAGARQAG